MFRWLNFSGLGRRRKELPLSDGIVADHENERPKASGENFTLIA